MFSCLVQDLATNAVAKESQVYKSQCGMYEGDKVGASAIGELFYTVNKVNLLIIHTAVVMQCFNLNLMCFL